MFYKTVTEYYYDIIKIFLLKLWLLIDSTHQSAYGMLLEYYHNKNFNNRSNDISTETTITDQTIFL